MFPPEGELTALAVDSPRHNRQSLHGNKNVLLCEPHVSDSLHLCVGHGFLDLRH
jgi:hypothetical protein